MNDSGRLLILADDFTGACDAAAAFATSRGTLVVQGLPAQWPNQAEGVQVLGVDLDLRERSNVEAEVLVSEVARRLCSADPALDILLKIDSTLRGPIAGLVAGALEGSGRQVAVIAPAFPEQGRLLRAGRVVVDGHLGASITDALGMHGTAVLGADFARSPEAVETAVAHAAMRGARHVVVDADGVDCLQNVATAWQRHAAEWLLVGSAGLTRQVAAALMRATNGAPGGDRTPHLDSFRHSPTSAAVSQVLVVAGSPAQATQAQIARLRGLGPIVLVGADIPLPPVPPGHNQVIVVCTPPATERDAGQSARAVADTTAAWAAELTPVSVILVGGATARLVCERLGAHGVRLRGELQPGIPHGALHGGQWHGTPVVTKAGGFGPPETLLDVLRALGVSSVAERTHD